MLCAAATAQLPAPNPTPRTAPRAHWVRMTVTGEPSQRRDNPGAASDDRLYVFGGRDGNANTAVYNALYQFDGTAFTVKTADGAAGSPPARGGACVAWDSLRSKLVVFGGDDGAGNLFGDTWEWDPVTNAWTDVTPTAGPRPAARRWAAMAFDPATGGMLLFGGETTPGGAPVNDTWLFLNGVWVQLPSTVAPPARRFASMCTRPDFGDVFLCGGTDDSTTPVTRHLDAWRWSGLAWSQFTTVTFPHGVNANQAVYDPLRQRIVLQGGQGISVPNSANGGQYGNDYGGSPSTWCSEFDCITNSWTLYGEPGFNTADPVIGRASRYFAAFVPALGTIVKFGGQDPSGHSGWHTYAYEADVVATFTSGSPGCAGSAGTPTLDGTRPWLGRDLEMSVSNTPAGSVSVLLVGVNTTSVPLSLFGVGAASCVITADPIATAVMPVSATTGLPTLALPIPVMPSLVSGPPLLNQALVVDFGTGTTLASNRGDATFGPL